MKMHCLELRITLHVTSFMRFLTTVYVRQIFSLKSAGANQTLLVGDPSIYNIKKPVILSQRLITKIYTNSVIKNLNPLQTEISVIATLRNLGLLNICTVRCENKL